MRFPLALVFFVFIQYKLKDRADLAEDLTFTLLFKNYAFNLISPGYFLGRCV